MRTKDNSLLWLVSSIDLVNFVKDFNVLKRMENKRLCNLTVFLVGTLVLIWQLVRYVCIVNIFVELYEDYYAMHVVRMMSIVT